MASIRRKLEKKGVIAMTLLTLVLIGTACEDRIDNPAVNPSEGKMVEVALNIGFANETDGYSLATKSGASSDKGAFSNELQPSTITKGDASVKPDQLYNLEIQQYDQSGKHIGGMESEKVTDHGIGTTLNVSLQADDNCQLVVVAWGSENKERLGTGNLESAQAKSLEASTISSLKPDVQGDMNKMPYVLHLKHVKVESNTIKSLDGQDVRLLLKRLATRLTINWTYSVKDYTLNQIILQSIPLNYKVVAAPDENNKYPSEIDQYTNIQLTEQVADKGCYSCWIPANVRGTNTASNSPLYRIKANAPTGSAYATFIAVNNDKAKIKLNYRIYLGGDEYSDFNLYENTDYSYTVNFNHTGIPTNDRRVTYIDPILASENNENFVNTANCFMVAPGGAFCFNPYNYYVDGKEKENGNDLLREWCKETKIKSVKVLWQTLENGDLGDPVLGTVNSPADHTNIVVLSDGNSFDKARIYCRVAPNTTGGSGVIAAYDDTEGKGNILWSWHIWVTDYSPDATGNEDVQKPENKRKQKFYRSDLPDQLPMMDRNLGAMAGYITVPPTPIEKSKTNGYTYQWGRKDPFKSSYTVEKVDNLTVPTSSTVPVKNLLNFYQADGISYCPTTTSTSTVSYQTAYQNPAILYCPQDGSIPDWLASGEVSDRTKSWGAGGVKTVHDPCPVGWRVCSVNNYKPLYKTSAYSNNLNLASDESLDPFSDGGVLVKYGSGDNMTYLRVAGYWATGTLFIFIGKLGYTWGNETTMLFRVDLRNESSNNKVLSSLGKTDYLRSGQPLRCIQERAD